jgi:2-aminoadipate transaminase
MLARTDLDAHIADIRALYREKANLMMALLDEKCPQIAYQRPEGGMFLWGTLPDGTDMPVFVQRCLDKKLALVPGNAFMVDETAPCQSFRMNFSTPTKENIQRGVDIMANVLAEMSEAKK